MPANINSYIGRASADARGLQRRRQQRHSI